MSLTYATYKSQTIQQYISHSYKLICTRRGEQDLRHKNSQPRNRLINPATKMSQKPQHIFLATNIFLFLVVEII
jgi:hypothetical protein